MPVYLFTYHAYRSWLPDREEGFVRRSIGMLPADEELAREYRERATENDVWLLPDIQLMMICELQAAFTKQHCRGYYIATEITHLHVLVGWQDERPWARLRNGLRQSLTRRLNRHAKRQHWFSDGASRKQVRERKHFDYLITKYLPSHRGWKWREGGEPFQ